MSSWNALQRAATLLAVSAALSTLPMVASAQQGGYERPSVTLVGLNLPANVAAALNSYCGERCANTVIGNRTDINTLGQWAYQYSGRASLVDAGKKEWVTGAPAAISEWLGASGITRNTILSLYGAQADYRWKLDILRTRANYAVTAAQATRLEGAENADAMSVMPRVMQTYFMVFTMTQPAMTTTTTLGTTTYHATAAVLGSSYQLGYASVDLVNRALTPLACFNCLPDSLAARQRRFASYVPPLREVVAFAENAVEGTGPNEAAALRDLIDEGLSFVIAKTSDKNAEFRVRTPVTAVNPIAGAIGSKEGVARNSGRFVVTARVQSGQTMRSVRRGVVIADRVVDNRAQAFGQDSGGAMRAARVNPTTFRQIHGGSIETRNTLEEKSYYGSFSAGALFGTVPECADCGSQSQSIMGIAGQFEMRNKLLPTGFYAGIGGVYYLGVPNSYTGAGFTVTAYRAGAALGLEMFPARGNLRLRLQGEGGMNFVSIKADQVEEAEEFEAGYYAAGTASLALAPSPFWNIFGAVHYTKNLSYTAMQGYPDTHPSGLAFSVGLRVEP